MHTNCWEGLEPRLLLAVTASYSSTTFILSVFGDSLDNTITVSRNAAGNLLVNGGAVAIAGGVPTVANTTRIDIFGQAGNDTLTLNESSGALPASLMQGSTGNDTITGGSGNDTIFGQSDNDVLLGKGGFDSLFGGTENDTLTGGDADDQVFGEAGNDRMIWNPGDDTDLNEGGDGADTTEVNGGGGAEVFTTTANGTRVRFDRLDPAPFSIDIGTTENLILNANGGNDAFSNTGNLAALISITADGGTGNDTMLGSNGIDLLLGGDGDDFIDGQQGNDVAFMGAGNDVFQWDPGDGSDVVEGQAGTDTLLFNGSAGAEIFTASANGGRVLFTRDLGSIVMDFDDVETLNLNALGNTDTTIVNSLVGTDLTQINVDLAGTIGGASGDLAIDSVVVNGTSADDILTLTLQGGNLLVNDLNTTVSISHFEASDTVNVLGQGDDDVIDASAVGAGGPGLVLDGGLGNDILQGGVGNDTMGGGDGDDVLLGNGGVDVLDGGSGDNILIQGGNNITSGIVSIFGTSAANTITISRDAGGNILSNGVVIPGATVANTALIRVFGRGGDDTITFNEASGALPVGAIYGGAGLDVLTGGSGSDLVFGGGGNDNLLGKGGFDMLFGGAENDFLTGGDADDQVFGEVGNDRMIWNPGDDTDLNEGGSGTDTVEINGGGGAEVFTTTANGARVRFDRLDPAPFSLDIGTSENLVLNANGGNDAFSNTGNLAALISITADGGAGNDTLLGSNGIDLLLGGDGDDFIDGQQGNDVAFMGAGNDVFQWDPGDGSDVVEGQAGTDTLLFNGSAGAEIFTASANGGRVLFTRDLGNIVMDFDDVEQLDLNTLGNTDTVTVNNLAGTDLIEMNINLAGTIGGAVGDAAADVVIVNGTNGDDVIDVVGAGTSASVIGLPAQVNITNSEGANDSLVINALGGNDGVTATTVPAGVIKFTADGGAGDDVLLGSQGADVFLGGANNDFIFGDNGNDLALMGAGNDVFQWDPGDGNDVIEGQDGLDTMLFFGSNSAENIDILANGGRVIFFRNVASVTMDLDDVETIDYRALGGADNIVVGDLSGTDVTTIGLDLRGPNGGGDGAADSITVNGTQGADVFGAVGDANGVNVFGLQAAVNLFFQEQANDRLTLNGLGGDDVVDATSLEADGIQLTENGGLGADVLLGSEGNDLINGGDGDDVALMGAGHDTFVWNPGDDNDVLEGQAGTDNMLFNGANVAENITISPNGGRVIFFRDIASVTMDLNDVEVIDFNALGGADVITVGTLNGTDVSSVNLRLQSSGGTGDAAADSVFIHGSASAETLKVSGDVNGLVFEGFAATVNVTGHEPANDLFTVRPLGGADTIAINNMTGIDGTRINVDLASTAGAASPDGQADQVSLNGNASANTIQISDVAPGTEVSGLSPIINVFNADAALDTLHVNAQAGADSITVNQSGAFGAVRRILVDAGTETDTITITNTAADGSATIVPSTGNDTVNVNTDGLFQANAIFAATQRIGALNIGPNGRATVSSDGNKVLTISTFSISSTGKLDMTNNDLIVDYTLSSPIGSIQSLLTGGYNGGLWNGNGIMTSMGNATTFALGYAEASDVALGGTFAGQAVDSTAVLVKFTYYGDANLSGSVDITDLGRLATNWQGTPRRWAQGNFNYDSPVNITDLGMLATNWQAGTGNPLGPSEPMPSLSSLQRQPIGTVTRLIGEVVP